MSSTMAHPDLSIATGVYGPQPPRLLLGAEREGVETYLTRGGYASLRSADALLARVADAGLRGRGGAAFPLARKIATVRTGGAAPVLVANGEEGEPASVKDRWLLRYRPHLVLDGLRLAAAMVGAQQAYVYVSDRAGADSIEAALQEFPAQGWNEIDVRVHRVEPSYVAGEETAAVRSINGGPALPQDKPPRPFEVGVDGRPTQISNVETLSNLPLIHANGAQWYRSVGTSDSAGTFLMTLSGTTRTGLFEVPFGTTLREVLAWVGEERHVNGVLMGGYFAGLLDPRALDIPLEYGALSLAGSGLGCGAIAVIDDETCPVGVASDVLSYFDRANAGQCGSCFNGTAAMAAVLQALRFGQAEPADIARLRRWSTELRGRGACGTLDGATNVAASLLREFPEMVQTHLDAACGICARPVSISPPYAILVDQEGAR